MVEEADLEYPSAEEIHELHAGVVAANDETESGMQTPKAVESALKYISDGYFGERPETLHEKAAHLMRLIAAEHPYVDGNKRTALLAAGYLFDLNGYELAVDDQIRRFLRTFATDVEGSDVDAVVDYLHEQTTKK